ncbi:hypothetical protein GQ464_001980 [Rhodocaloribacter litoris]|uniref:hypothetical protein n=1 Tax=Rhodocaloribacter litoris TaxID=2558931 RepID=UPI0014202BC5|nr:hypothetical protein [Rhodocaloribacter litoris]QXD15738.1 hypothetical protein GQ464_001980 [Rhodocaloribacter litoris]
MHTLERRPPARNTRPTGRGTHTPSLQPGTGHAFSTLKLFPEQRPASITPSVDQEGFVATATRHPPLHAGSLDPGPVQTQGGGGSGGGGGTFVCPIGAADFTSIPSGTLAATFGSGKFGASFAMNARFHIAPVSAPCTDNCKCGEYRQFVRGYFNYNGTDVTHQLCANTLSRTTWHEDCVTIGGTDHKYGYHAIPFATSKFKDPDQATGCKFEGFDFPGFSLGSLSSGDRLDMHLEFEGRLVDACDGDKTIKSSSWVVEGNGTVP